MITLENYIGKYIKNENTLDYQSINLVNDYIKRLTNYAYRPEMNAQDLYIDDIPKNWEIKTIDKGAEFRRGDIFITRNKMFGFNGIVTDVIDDRRLKVISMNAKGTGNDPVCEHDYEKSAIDYVVRPDKNTLIIKGVLDVVYKKYNSKNQQDIIINEKYAVKINSTTILKDVISSINEYTYAFTNIWENALLIPKENAEFFAERLGGYTVKVTEKLEVEE